MEVTLVVLLAVVERQVVKDKRAELTLEGLTKIG
jgi:hypothetical protein